MADSSAIRRIQFGDEISQVKTTGACSSFNKDSPLSSSEKTTNVDLEERAARLNDADNQRKKKQKYSAWTVAYLGFQSIGVVYGDIGTSPLYVYSSTFTSQPSYEDLVGALSIIIWTLTLLVSIKYAFIVLAADVSNILLRFLQSVY